MIISNNINFRGLKNESHLTKRSFIHKFPMQYRKQLDKRKLYLIFKGSYLYFNGTVSRFLINKRDISGFYESDC